MTFLGMITPVTSSQERDVHEATALPALPPSLMAALNHLTTNPPVTLSMQQHTLAARGIPTPTEEDSCSCATCGSTCCD